MKRLIDASLNSSFQIIIITQKLLGVRMFACFLQCGCLDSAVRDRVYKDAAEHFFVCSLSVSVKGAEACRFGPGVGKVGRMHLSSQSLWCYC